MLIIIIESHTIEVQEHISRIILYTFNINLKKKKKYCLKKFLKGTNSGIT